jgi:hypothetical protein
LYTCAWAPPSPGPLTVASLDPPLGPALVMVCVWFEDKGGWDMAIHGFWDIDIHVVCLVGWMERVIFLFRWMDEIVWGENT